VAQTLLDLSIRLQIVEMAEKMAQHGKIVIMSLLSGTFLRQPFNDVLELIPKAEKVKFLNAICKICSASAAFSLRTTVDSRVELIGGSDLYIPVCRECFNFKTQ
jgi:thymidine kinase